MARKSNLDAFEDYEISSLSISEIRTLQAEAWASVEDIADYADGESAEYEFEFETA